MGFDEAFLYRKFTIFYVRKLSNLIVQGAIEKSNVNSVSAMVELIDAHRRFDQSQKAIKSIDELNSGLIDKNGYKIYRNLDKIASYFNATATQLFGSELEIQLEIGHDNIDEYVKKATTILEARNAIPEILSFQEKINNMVRSEKFE